MGVRCLQLYLEKINKNTCYKVNIKELIRNFRNDTNFRPVIVIDGVSFGLHNHHLISKLRGGQIKEYEERLRKFILTFKNAGADLVFFYDGPRLLLEKWRNGNIKRMDVVHDIFALLEEGESAIEMDTAGLITSSIYFTTMYVAKMLGCEVFTAVRDGDVEIAEYAFQNKCMAVLAQDTDFVIFNNAKYYFSLNHFDLSEMTTMVYDREIFARSIGLPLCQLPLLACLLGNDFISIDLLQPFHKKLLADRVKHCEKWFHIGVVITRLASFIMRRMSKNPYDQHVLEQIAHEVFNDKSMWALLHQGISYYNFSSNMNKNPGFLSSKDENWDKILKKAFEEQRTKFVFQNIYGILAYKRYSPATIMEDYTKRDLPPAMKVLKPLRAKWYGILLYENPEDCNIEEWVVCGPYSLDEPDYVKPEKPNVDHPGLLSLWSGNSKAHWTLIADMFNVNSFKMRSLPTHLILPALVLRYLNEKVKIFKWELSALVSSAVLVQFYEIEDIKKIQLPSYMYNTRPLRLYTLVTKAYSIVISIFCSFGETIPTKMMAPSNYQDGKLYHLKYVLALQNYGVEELCEEKSVAIDYYHRLMKFITETKKTLF